MLALVYYFPKGTEVETSSGKVTCLIYGNQTIAAHYTYDSFGNTLSLSGPLAYSNTYRFAGKEWDVRTGFYYFAHRYYSPSLQRFINRDPIGERGGRNLYGYCGNDAINRYDPTGLIPCWLQNALNILDVDGLFPPDDSNPDPLANPAKPLDMQYYDILGGIHPGLTQQQLMDLYASVVPVPNYVPPGVVALSGEPSSLNLLLVGLGPIISELLAADIVPTIGQIIGDAHPDSMIHLTTATEAQLANGMNEGSSFVRLGDVSNMTVAEYQAQVVGLNAAGSTADVTAFVVVNPGAYQFVPAFEQGAAGVPEYLSTWRFLVPNSYVPLP